MISPNAIDTPEKLLSLLRRVRDLADIAEEGDQKFAVLAGLTPKDLLSEFLGHYPEMWVTKLRLAGKIWESETYLKPNPRIRTRALPTRYDIDKPHVSGIRRFVSTYKIRGKDKLLLWYAVANKDMSGSLGEAAGLSTILDFFRNKNVQRIWKRLHPTWRLPEDAK